MTEKIETLTVPVTELNFVAQGYRASQLLGAPVYNDEGVEIGIVKEFVVTHKDYVAYAILEVGRFLGLEQKFVAIPARRFMGLTGKIILPGATKQALETLSAFTFSHN